MIDYDAFLREHGKKIFEETKLSSHNLTERGMVFKHEETGSMRLLFDRSWWGTPRRLILPIPDEHKRADLIIIHSHLNTPIHSFTDMTNFIHTPGLVWLGTAVYDKHTDTVRLRSVNLRTLVPRGVGPSTVAFLENILNYKYNMPTGPRVHIKDTVIRNGTIVKAKARL